MRVLIAAILGSLIFGEIYAQMTGKKRNPYHPLNVLMWNPGGLAIGAPMTIYDTINTMQRVIMAEDETERGQAIHQLTIDIPRMGDMFIPFYMQTIRFLEAATDEKYIDRKTLRQIREIFDESYELNEEFYKKERDLLGKFQHAIFGGEPPDPSQMAVAIENTEEAMEKLGEWDEEKAAIFTTQNLASALRSSLKNMDFDEVAGDNGFPPITVFYMDCEQWLNRYYDLPEAKRDQFLEAYPDVVTYLYFWGRWKANMGAETERIVRSMAEKYGIPESAIPALAGLPSRIETPKPTTTPPSVYPRGTEPMPVNPYRK